jgi:hypothetical protein
MNIMAYSKIESYIHTKILCPLCSNTDPERQAKTPTLVAQLNESKSFVTFVSGIQPCQLAFISVFYIYIKQQKYLP